MDYVTLGPARRAQGSVWWSRGAEFARSKDTIQWSWRRVPSKPSRLAPQRRGCRRELQAVELVKVPGVKKNVERGISLEPWGVDGRLMLMVTRIIVKI